MKKILLSLAPNKVCEPAIAYALQQAALRQADLIVSCFIGADFIDKFTDYLQTKYFIGLAPARDVAVIACQVEFERAHQLLDDVLERAKRQTINSKRILTRGSDYRQQSYRLARDYGVDLFVICKRSGFKAIEVIKSVSPLDKDMLLLDNL